MVQPKNPNIVISPLGEQRTFVSGTKNWRIDWAILNKQRFDIGDVVSWKCLDDIKSYKGKIDWMIIVEDGNVEVSIDNPNVGRLPLDELILRKKA